MTIEGNLSKTLLTSVGSVSKLKSKLKVLNKYTLNILEQMYTWIRVWKRMFATVRERFVKEFATRITS